MLLVSRWTELCGVQVCSQSSIVPEKLDVSILVVHAWPQRFCINVSMSISALDWICLSSNSSYSLHRWMTDLYRIEGSDLINAEVYNSTKLMAWNTIRMHLVVCEAAGYDLCRLCCKVLCSLVPKGNWFYTQTIDMLAQPTAYMKFFQVIGYGYYPSTQGLFQTQNLTNAGDTPPFRCSFG
jgi:hypothetical protein